MTIETVLFDIDATLIDNNEPLPGRCSGWVGTLAQSTETAFSACAPIRGCKIAI